MLKTSRDHLLNAFRRVLRPLIRILVRSGVRYDEFLKLVRGVYVETAVRDGLGDGLRPTRARISVSTGVARRDVDRFIDNEGDVPVAQKSLTRRQKRRPTRPFWRRCRKFPPWPRSWPVATRARSPANGSRSCSRKKRRKLALKLFSLNKS